MSDQKEQKPTKDTGAWYVGELPPVRTQEAIDNLGMSKESFTNRLKKFIKKQGAQVVGICDALPWEDEVDFSPKRYMRMANSVIVFGVMNNEAAVDYAPLRMRLLTEGYTENVVKKIHHNVTRTMQGYGFVALPMILYYIHDMGQLKRDPSYRGVYREPIDKILAAEKAGLGVRGKNDYLLNPDYGPRLMLGVILTDAPLIPDTPISNLDFCSSCKICEETCPTGAIREGHEFDIWTCISRQEGKQMVYQVDPLRGRFVRRQTGSIAAAEFEPICPRPCYTLCPVGSKRLTKKFPKKME
jgi:epoxyqueuosine reductase QueG